MDSNRVSNETIMWYTIAGLVAFSIFMFYIVIKNPPWAGLGSLTQGAGPQPTSTGSGTGA